MSSDFEGLTTRVLRPTPTLELLGVEVVVVDGADRGRRVALGAGALRVGTAPGCELRLADGSVSRLHCEIRRVDGRIGVLDLGSTNGTFVDGVPVRDADLLAGATVRVGSSSLRVETSGEPVFVPLSADDHFGPLVGGSVAMRRVYALLERVAPTDATVLVLGETGTGKELVARAIHEHSRRAGGPFVEIDCGAIAENLIESELFGHVRGAFSGAVSDRRGLFEQAHGGTVFLDEIGELPMSLQPKLLRALETRSVRPVGGNAVRAVDVRVVAATNRSLAQAVNEGSFREDLYYRLAVVEAELPPLRARRDDIPALVGHFFERFAGDASPPPGPLVAATLTRGWPGNVRELRNFVERCVSLGWSLEQTRPAPSSPPSLLPPGLDALVPVHLPLKEARLAWMEQFETAYVRALLTKTSGNVTHAADLAGVSRRFLQRTLARLGLRSAEPPGDDER